MHFHSTTLGEISEIYDGPHATPVRQSSGPIFLGIASLNKGRLELSLSDHISEEDFIVWTRRVTPTHGDIVFSYETKLGEAARIPDGLRCCLGRRMGLMRPKPEYVDSKYLLYHYLSESFQTQLKQYTVHGSTVDRFSLLEFPSIPITLPPLAEQRRIADILGTLDDKIELNRRQNATLEALARALFTAWFVDFEPVRAKAEGRWRQGESLPGMPAELWELFPDSFVDSALGPIPAGWEVGSIGEHVTIHGGTTPSTSNPEFYDGGTHFWATPKDLSQLKTSVLLDTERKITDAGLAKIGSGLLPAGTVLMSSRAPIGYLAITEVPSAINQGFIAIQCNKLLSNRYVLRWCEVNMEVIISKANGSTFLEISKSNFRDIPLVLPPQNILEFFSRFTGTWAEKIVTNVRQSHNLSDSREKFLVEFFRD